VLPLEGASERYSLVIDADQVVVRAVEPAGVARGLTTLIQLLAARPPAIAGEISVPGARILDAPRFAWRGLSLDLARAFFTAGEVRRVIDLLALYKLNVLHLHLTDDQSWRLPVGRPATVTAWRGMAGCGRKTISRTSAPQPSTGSRFPAAPDGLDADRPPGRHQPGPQPDGEGHPQPQPAAAPRVTGPLRALTAQISCGRSG
jgi:N-acetyl-beta-hexosaminidase